MIPLKTLKIWIAGFLVFTLFASGSPVITNGNLTFEAYDPPSYYGATISTVVEDAVLDYDSYNIDGTDAFYFLPYHGNAPTDVFDLQVFDYNSDGNFVYAYVAYFYGNAATVAEQTGAVPSGGSSSGLTVTQSGTATAMGDKSNEMRSDTISQALVGDDADGGPTNVVVTVMSYNPYTLEYTVFLTKLFDLDSVTVNLTAEESGLEDDILITTDVNSISGHKLMDVEQYFVCVGVTGYLFEKNGTLLSEANYLSSAQNELSSQGVDMTNKEIEILDAVMDGSGYAHVAITMTDAIDEDNMEDISEEEDVTEYLMGYHSFPLNTDPAYTDEEDRDSTIVFRSTNLSQSDQEEAWMRIDGETYTSLADLQTAQNTYSIDNITSGNFDEDTRDEWEPFHWANFVLRDFVVDKDHVDDALNETFQNYNMAFSCTYTVTFSALFYSETNTYNISQEMFSNWNQYGWNNDYWTDGLVHMLLGDDFYNLLCSYDSWVEAYIAGNGTTDTLVYITPTYDDAMLVMVEAAGESAGARLLPIEVSGVQQMVDSPDDRTLGGDVASMYMAYEGTVFSEPLVRTLYLKETTYDEEGEAIGTSITEYKEEYPARAVEYSIDWADSRTTNPYTGETEDYELVYTLSWMDLQESNNYALPSRELGVYYYNTIEQADATAGTSAVSAISYNDGYDTRVDDDSIQGAAREAQLFYTDTMEILAVLTDEGVQYYSRGINGTTTQNYTKGSFITLDAFTPNSSNYFVTDQSIYTEYSGEATSLSSLDQFALLNNEEMIVSSQTDGLILHNLNSNIFFSLDDGCYYQSFSVSGDEGQFMVLGYDTTDYAYDGTDLVWAKCYSKDIGQNGATVREDFVISYVESVANLYWQYTHLLGVDADGALYVEKASDEQQAVIDRGYNLFFSSGSALTSELKVIATECGQSTVSDTITQAVVDIRSEMQLRYVAIKTLFSNVDIVRTPLDTQQVALLNLEYELLYAKYEYRLENLLVEAYLRQLYGLGQDYDALCDDLSAAQTNDTPIPDEALKFISTLQSQFALYYDNAVVAYDQNDYVGRDTTFAELAESSDQGKYLYLLTGLEVLLETETDGGTYVSDGSASVSYGTAYVDILSVLSSKLANAGTEVDWSTYVTNMLYAVNPYNALADASEAASEFCTLVGIDSSQEAEVLTRLCEIYEYTDLERLIVEYNITKTAYVGSAMASDWETHLNNTYSTSREKDVAFYAGSFYAIVTQYQVEYDTYHPDAKTITWSSKLTTLLRACSGLVLS